MKLLQSSTRWQTNLISRVSKLAPFSTSTSNATSPSNPINTGLMHRRISPLGDPKSSVVPNLSKWIDQGKDVKRVREALEMSESMSNTELLVHKPSDMAMRLDLISEKQSSAGRKFDCRMLESGREKLLGQLKTKCWNLMGHDKVRDLVVRLLDQGGIEELRKGMEIMSLIALKKRGIPYGSNSYLNEMRKMEALASNITNTNTSIETVKIKSIYQSASLIAQDIASQLRKKGSIRTIANRLARDIPRTMRNKVVGFRISCSGRIDGVDIAKTQVYKYGKTSRTSIRSRVDYAVTKAPTRYGILGVKVWVWYRNKRSTAQ